MTTRNFHRTYLLNVGMDRNDGQPANTDGALMVALQRAGLAPMGTTYHTSNTERTAVLQFDTRPTVKQVDQLSRALAQDCIALYLLPSGDGTLIGPKARKWGPFNPAYFLLPNGRPAAQYGQAPPLGGRPGAGHRTKKNTQNMKNCAHVMIGDLVTEHVKAGSKYASNTYKVDWKYKDGDARISYPSGQRVRVNTSEIANDGTFGRHLRWPLVSGAPVEVWYTMGNRQ